MKNAADPDGSKRKAAVAAIEAKIKTGLKKRQAMSEALDPKLTVKGRK